MIAIVGKGPSLIGKNMGSLIDACNVVVRTAGGKLDNDYGHKTDYIIVTTLSIPEIEQSDLTGVKGIWIYKTRTRLGYSDCISYVKSLFDGEIKFANIQEWIEEYRKTATVFEYSPKVNYPSKGTVAAIMAMKSFDYPHVIVAGFDYITGRTKVAKPKHDFKVEKELLFKAANQYNKTLKGMT